MYGRRCTSVRCLRPHPRSPDTDTDISYGVCISPRSPILRLVAASRNEVRYLSLLAVAVNLIQLQRRYHHCTRLVLRSARHELALDSSFLWPETGPTPSYPDCHVSDIVLDWIGFDGQYPHGWNYHLHDREFTSRIYGAFTELASKATAAWCNRWSNNRFPATLLRLALLRHLLECRNLVVQPWSGYLQTRLKQGPLQLLNDNIVARRIHHYETQRNSPRIQPQSDDSTTTSESPRESP